MKFLRVGIVIVLSVVSVGIIATSVYKMTQETVKNEVVTFEVLTLDEVTGIGTVTSGTYDKILLYSEINEFKVTNTVSVLINDIEFLSEFTYLGYFETAIQLYDRSEGDYDSILPDDILEIALGFLSLNDVVSITFEVQEAQLSGVTATLILLTPLIFAGGVLAFMLNKQEF